MRCRTGRPVACSGPSRSRLRRGRQPRHQRPGRQSVQEHAQQDRETDGGHHVADGPGTSCRSSAAISANTTEARPRGPNQPMKITERQSTPEPEQRQGDRDHAHDRETDHRVQRGCASSSRRRAWAPPGPRTASSTASRRARRSVRRSTPRPGHRDLRSHRTRCRPRTRRRSRWPAAASRSRTPAEPAPARQGPAIASELHPRLCAMRSEVPRRSRSPVRPRHRWASPSRAAASPKSVVEPAWRTITAIAMVTTGVAMPSFRPLSTFSVCRIRYANALVRHHRRPQGGVGRRQRRPQQHARTTDSSRAAPFRPRRRGRWSAAVRCPAAGRSGRRRGAG